MNMICPNCGYCRQSSDYAPELARLALGSKRMAVITRLSQAAGAYVSGHQLIDFVYGDDEDGGPLCANTAISAHVSKIRAALSGSGWVLENKRYRGYRLVRDGHADRD